MLHYTSTVHYLSTIVPYFVQINWNILKINLITVYDEQFEFISFTIGPLEIVE